MAVCCWYRVRRIRQLTHCSSITCLFHRNPSCCFMRHLPIEKASCGGNATSETHWPGTGERRSASALKPGLVCEITANTTYRSLDLLGNLQLSTTPPPRITKSAISVSDPTQDKETAALGLWGEGKWPDPKSWMDSRQTPTGRSWLEQDLWARTPCHQQWRE